MLLVTVEQEKQHKVSLDIKGRVFLIWQCVTRIAVFIGLRPVKTDWFVK